MSDPTRIPLVPNLAVRSASVDKDAVSKNVYFDKSQNGTVYAAKRPGLTSYISGSGQAYGIYSYRNGAGENVFVWGPGQGDGPLGGGKVPVSVSVIYDNSRIVVIYEFVSPAGYCLTYTSSNEGTTWLGPYSTQLDDWLDIAYSGSKYVAVGGNTSYSESNAIYSTDGSSWTTSTMPSIPGSAWSFIVNMGSSLYAFSAAKTTISTDGGVTWSAYTSGNVNAVNVATNGTRLVKAGVHKTTGNSSIETSTDGVNWSLATNPLNPLINLRGIACDGTNFAIFTDGNSYTYSAGGTSWSSGTVPTLTLTQFITCYGDSTGLYAVYYDNFGNIPLIYSTDGGATFSYINLPVDYLYDECRITITPNYIFIFLPLDGIYDYIYTDAIGNAWTPVAFSVGVGINYTPTYWAVS